MIFKLIVYAIIGWFLQLYILNFVEFDFNEHQSLLLTLTITAEALGIFFSILFKEDLEAAYKKYKEE